MFSSPEVKVLAVLLLRCRRLQQKTWVTEIMGDTDTAAAMFMSRPDLEDSCRHARVFNRNGNRVAAAIFRSPREINVTAVTPGILSGREGQLLSHLHVK